MRSSHKRVEFLIATEIQLFEVDTYIPTHAKYSFIIYELIMNIRSFVIEKLRTYKGTERGMEQLYFDQINYINILITM